jgi:hypothetical protein
MGEYAADAIIGKDSNDNCLSDINSNLYSYCGRGYCKTIFNKCVLLDSTVNFSRNKDTSAC